MTNYNQIMETLERELIGRNVQVILDYLDGPNKLVFKDRLEDAVYETRIGNVKRIGQNDEDSVEDLRLGFTNSEITLSGYGLTLEKSRLESGFLLGDGLDNPLLLKLEEVK